MKKASKICLLIGGILGLVLTLVWLIVAIVMFVYAGVLVAWHNGADMPQAMAEAISSWARANGHYYDTYEGLLSALIAQGVLYVIMMLFALPCAILSFILRGKEKTGLPLPIVVAVLAWSGNVASFVGAGLAIANWAVVERKEGQQAEQPKEEDKAEQFNHYSINRQEVFIPLVLFFTRSISSDTICKRGG